MQKEKVQKEKTQEEKMNSDTVEILWTGGYDSSFRICQLSKLPIKIKPYYLVGERLSKNKELEAIENITKALKTKPDTRCTFLDLEIVPKEELEKIDHVTTAYKRIKEENKLGTQYEGLGWLAYKYPGVELSVQKDGRIDAILHKYKSIKRIECSTIGRYYKVDMEKAPEHVKGLFGNYHFPLIEYTKLKMKKEYIKLGCEDIIDMTWFCHKPIDGKVCGRCNPCKFVVEEGMKYRLSKEALTNYKERMKKIRRKNMRKSKPWRALRKVKNFALGK